MGRRLILHCLTAAVCLLCCGCPPPQPLPDDGQVERYYGGIDGPAQLADGGSLLLDGDMLWRLDGSGNKVSERQIPSQSDAGGIGAGYEWEMKSLGLECYLRQDYYWLSRLNLDGSLAWSSRFKAVISWFEPLPGGGVAVYWQGGGTSTDDRLQVINAAGKELWGRSFKFGSYPSPTLGGAGRIYVTSGQSLLCLDSATGNTLWEVPAGNTGGTILDGNASGLLTTGSAFAAYNSEGSLRWLAPAGLITYPQRGLLLEDGGAAVISHDIAVSELEVIGPDGQLRGSYAPSSGGSVYEMCLLDAERLAVRTYDAQGYGLRLIELNDLSEIWTLPLPDNTAPNGPMLEVSISSREMLPGADGLLWLQQGKVLYGVNSEGTIARSYEAQRYFERTYLNGEWH